MKINKSTVYNWAKSLSNKIERSKPKDKISKEVIEMDELYGYIKDKKQNLYNNICNKKT